MTEIVALMADASVFVLVPWIIWRIIFKSIPISVMPILVGISLAVMHVPVSAIGVPSS